MKFKILLVTLLAGFFSSCNKQCRFDNGQLKKALFICLNDHDLKGRLFSDSLTNKRTHLYLYGNVALNDSLKIDERVYYIHKGLDSAHGPTVLFYRLTYKNERAANIYLSYQPGHGYKVFSKCDFVFNNDEWKLENRTNGIIDGRF